MKQNCGCPATGNPFFGELCVEHLTELKKMNPHLRIALIKIYWASYLRDCGELSRPPTESASTRPQAPRGWAMCEGHSTSRASGASDTTNHECGGLGSRSDNTNRKRAQAKGKS